MLSKSKINQILSTVHTILLSQSSIVVDYLHGEELCDWQRTNEESIKQNLDTLQEYLSTLKVTHEDII